MKNSVLFLLGGSAYVLVEYAWRSTSHWTMFVAGGLCLCFLQWLALHPRLPLLAAGGIGALGVSGLELLIGLVCTRLLHRAVWDYSNEWANLAGLICPKYTLLWFLLCTWILAVMRGLRKALPAPTS